MWWYSKNIHIVYFAADFTDIFAWSEANSYNQICFDAKVS